MCYTVCEVIALTIGEKIRFARKEKGLTQKELASKSGVAEISIRNYENGKRQQPRVEQLGLIANALQMNFENFLDNGETTSPGFAALNWLESLGFMVRQYDEEGADTISIRMADSLHWIQLNRNEFNRLVDSLTDYTHFTLHQLNKGKLNFSAAAKKTVSVEDDE